MRNLIWRVPVFLLFFCMVSDAGDLERLAKCGSSEFKTICLASDFV